MPNGAAAAIPLGEERNRAAILRAAQREARVGAPPAPPSPPPAVEAAEIAAEEEAEAARALETERLTARRQAQARAQVRTAEASKRFRKEVSKRAAQWTIRMVNELIGEVVLSETIVMPIISAIIMNIQLIFVNILRGGESLTFPGFEWLPGAEIPPLAWWEVVLVVFIDIIGLPLAILLNPITLPILVIVVIAAGGLSIIS